MAMRPFLAIEPLEWPEPISLSAVPVFILLAVFMMFLTSGPGHEPTWAAANGDKSVTLRTT
jgi:hypothetical protein